MSPLLIAGLAAAVLAALLVWEIYVCEGTHLGPRVVIWMYDLAAGAYDRIKQFDPAWEARFVGEPIAGAIEHLSGARILDAGAGTGRVARALLPLTGDSARLICAEPSRGMLQRGRRIAPAASWVRGRADPLPFADETFDVVVSLELLEFTPAPKETLRELIRVLRPGGHLLVTNRIGWQSRLILGRTTPREAFPDRLRSLGLKDVILYPWQVEYDLAWAWKP